MLPAFLLLLPLAFARENCSTLEEIVHNLTENYRTVSKPSENGVKVFVKLWVQAVTDLDELSSDFNLDIYLTERWHDPNLNFKALNPCKENLSIDYSFLEKTWKPNTVFINTKYVKIHNSPFENFFVQIFPNGTIWINYRMKVIGPCEMDFYRFPMDSVKCFLEIESFSHDHTEVEMVWSPFVPHVWIMHDKIELPDFSFVNWTTHHVIKDYVMGTWSHLIVNFYFQRRFMWYILQAYIPNYLMVFVSWVNFCLGVQMLPARTIVCVSSLLGLIVQFGNISWNLPRAAYIKALDVWMVICLSFVVGSLAELAAVAYCTNQKELDHNQYESHKSENDRNFIHRFRFSIPDANTISLVDRISGLIFPLFFILVNIVYWSVYLSYACA